MVSIMVNIPNTVINKLTMDCLKCPLCNRKSNEPINLRCDHHPCFQCASQIITVDHESPLQTKYRIICPICYKKTITYDLRHLIINATEQDQDMYVTTKFISKKPQLSLIKKSNHPESSKASGHSKHNSTGTPVLCPSNRAVGIQCKKHAGSNLQYLCEDCYDKNQCDIFLCCECAKGHKHSRLLNLWNAGEKVHALNQRKRENIFCGRYEFLKNSFSMLKTRKQAISNDFQILYKEVAEEFKSLYQYINQQYESVKKDLKAVYNKQCDEIKNNMSLVQKFQESLEQLEKIPTDSCSEIETHVHYSMCVAEIEKAIENNRNRLCEKFQLPKIVKKHQITLGSPEKFIQIQVGMRSKQCSRPVTPTNSARFFNYNIDISKNMRPESRGPDISMVKQNFNPLSPKNYYSNKIII